MGLFEKIKNNMFLRNVILAVCVLIILVFLAQIFLNLVTRHGQVHEVPDFGGMTMEEAEQAARKASLDLEINDSLFLPLRAGGIVLEQNPAPGAKVKSGRRIFLTVNAFSPKIAEIPYVAGYSLRQAKNNLEVAGFEIEKLVYREDIATNNVLEQRFKGRTVLPGSKLEAPTGSGVVLVVGMKAGEASVKTPKVVGFPLQEAKSRLWEQGLNLGQVFYDKGVTEVNVTDARVYKQEPNAGGHHMLGTAINLYLSLDDKTVAAGSKAADNAALEAAKQAEQAVEEEEGSPE